MMMGGRRGGDGGGDGRVVLPGWLEGLVEESFFVGCGSHESRKKNEKNIFCLGCCTSICTHCLSSHPSHPLIQVRRYVYNDVVQLENLEKLIDCSYVQPYTINSAKVVFLKPRPHQSRPFKGTGNLCLTCDRILQEPFHFCCLSCKVDHVVLQGGNDYLSSILFRFDAESHDLTLSHFENLNMRMDGPDLLELEGHMITSNSILEEDPLQNNNNNHRGSSSRGNSDFHQVPKRMKNKKDSSSSSGFYPDDVLSLGSSKRKGAPRRSPLS